MMLKTVGLGQVLDAVKSDDHHSFMDACYTLKAWKMVMIKAAQSPKLQCAF